MALHSQNLLKAMNTKKINGCIFVLNLFFIFTFLQSVSAQVDDVLRIEFAVGQTSKIVRANMKRESLIHDYAVRARVGQLMSVSLITNNRRAYFSIICPGCTQIGDTPLGMKNAYKIRRWTSKTPDAGDYTIRVGTDKPAAYAYALKIIVRDQNLTVENPQLLRRITGTYLSKNNSLDAQLLPNGSLKFDLTAIWKSPVNREVIHFGEIQSVVLMKDNFAIYEKGQCKIVMEFLPSKVDISQTGSDADCGFGANVNAAGTYRKRNSRVPAFDTGTLISAKSSVIVEIISFAASG